AGAAPEQAATVAARSPASARPAAREDTDRVMGGPSWGGAGGALLVVVADAELHEQAAAQDGEVGGRSTAVLGELDGHVERETALREDEDPVGEEDRLVDVVGHEQDGRRVA